MVCLGNICRSPLAHGIMAKLLDHNLYKVDSAGTAGYHIGAKPDARSIDVAQKNGVDISKQQARKFSEKDFERFDYIFVMDTNNEADVLRLAKSENDRKKVFRLTQYAQLDQKNVPDPYYGTTQDFEEVFELIEEACKRIALKI